VAVLFRHRDKKTDGSASFKQQEQYQAFITNSIHIFHSSLSLDEPHQSFLERFLLEETTMKARLLTTEIKTGQVARDFIHLASENQDRSRNDTGSEFRPAHAVLESFEDQSRSIPADSIVPIKRLVKVLTESLQGMPGLVTDDGRTSGARLFRGLKVRLRGIPERQFIIRDIYWDFGEARIKEIGADTFYLVPWDCLEIIQEQTE
jgi:hypothetical protein